MAANNNNNDIEINDDNDMKRCYENLIVIDAGANLTNKKYSRDLDSVVQRAKDAGKTFALQFYQLSLSDRNDIMHT